MEVIIDLYSEAQKLSFFFGTGKASEKIKKAILQNPEKCLPQALNAYHRLGNDKAKTAL